MSEASNDTAKSPMDALFGQLSEKDLKKLAAKIEPIRLSRS